MTSKMNICLITILFCTILSSAFAAVVPFEKDDSVVRTGDQVEYLCSVEAVDSEGGLTLLYRASDGQVMEDREEMLSGERVREMVEHGMIRNLSRAAAQISRDDGIMEFDGIVEFEEFHREDMDEDEKKMPANDEEEKKMPASEEEDVNVNDSEAVQHLGVDGIDSNDSEDLYFDIDTNAAEFLIEHGYIGQAMLAREELEAMDECPNFAEVQTEILFREFYDCVTRSGKFSNSILQLKEDGTGEERPKLSVFTLPQIFPQLCRFVLALMCLVKKWTCYCMTYDPKFNRTDPKKRMARLGYHRDGKGLYKNSKFRIIFTFGRWVRKVTTFKTKKKGVSLNEKGNQSHIITPHGSVMFLDRIGSGKFSNFHHKVNADGASLSVVFDVWLDEEMSLNEFIDSLVKMGVLEYMDIQIVEEDREEED